jgi:phage baseplate assembly protein W
VILLTRPGEQLMRPRYGAGLDQYLHDPNTLTTRRRIRDTVVQSITRWESRLILDRVDVWPIDGRADAVRVEIAYRLKRTGVATTMKLTMSLGS